MSVIVFLIKDHLHDILEFLTNERALGLIHFIYLGDEPVTFGFISKVMDSLSKCSTPIR